MPRIVGNALVVAGGLIFIVSTFLPWLEFGSADTSYWELLKRWDVVTVILAVAMIAFAVAGMLHGARVWTFTAAGLALLAFGNVAGYAVETQDPTGWGTWVGLVAVLLAAAGAVLLFLSATAAPQGGPAPAATPAAPAAPATPAAGWYPDPSGSGGQRYWDGARWTDQTRAG